MDQQQERGKMVAEAVQAELQRRNLTVNAFSQRFGFDRNTFTRFANQGRGTLDLVERWARSMGLDVNRWRVMCGYPPVETDLDPATWYKVRAFDLGELAERLGIDYRPPSFHGGTDSAVETREQAEGVIRTQVEALIADYPEHTDALRGFLEGD
jgi:transcriptional regulator with XRE-family HTH domain